MTAPFTMKDIRAWPPTVDVGTAARPLGISRSSMYESLRRGDCPVRSIKVGGRIRILTASLIKVLEGD